MDMFVLIAILLITIIFIILATSKLHWHPFIVLIVATYFIALFSGIPGEEIAPEIATGFGNILSYIGLVIIFGSLIGTFLEKSGAAITLANAILKLIGPKYPTLAMSLMGFVVSIPVFCDSGFIILNSIRKSMVRTSRLHSVSLTVALSTGLFAAHTLVPPTPGPIAAAANLGLQDQLGWVIVAGLGFSLVALAAGYFWAVVGTKYLYDDEDQETKLPESVLEDKKLPSLPHAVIPIVVPILLIALGSVAVYPTAPLGNNETTKILIILGHPVNALFVGLICCLPLFPNFKEPVTQGWFNESFKSIANILLITGAGGALGHIIKTSQIGTQIGEALATLDLNILLPFVIAAGIKTAQGSSTVAMVTTSALMVPLMATLELDSVPGGVLTVMAIGAGAMTVSHANDSYFWVVSQFSGMSVETAYRSHTMATLLQGVTTMTALYVVSLFLL